MKELLDSIQEKKDDFQRLLCVLKLWNAVEEQGIDPDAVKCFGFNSTHLKGQDKRAFQMGTKYHGTKVTCEDGSRVIEPSHFTYVRLKTGEIVQLDPILRRPPTSPTSGT